MNPVFRKLASLVRKPYQLFDGHVSSTITVMIIIGIIVFILSWDLYINKFSEFYPQVLSEAHGMVFDLAIIGVVLYLLDEKRRNKSEIKRYLEELEDIHLLRTKEGSLRVSGIIKRLNRYNVYKLNLKEYFLQSANLKGSNLVGSNFTYSDMRKVKLSDSKLDKCVLNSVNATGAKISNCSFRCSNANGIELKDAQCFNTNFEESIFVTASFEGSKLMSCSFKGGTLIKVNFTDAHLYRVDFTGTSGLSAKSLLCAKVLDHIVVSDAIAIELLKLNGQYSKTPSSEPGHSIVSINDAALVGLIADDYDTNGKMKLPLNL